MESKQTDYRTSIPARIIRISMLIVLGWFTLLVKIINVVSGFLLGAVGKMLRGKKSKA